MSGKIEEKLKYIEQRAPSSDKEAKDRFNKWHNRDPYPEISASLLNSSDLCDYVVTTGMVSPFHPTIEDLKSATYSFRIKGNVIHWPQGSEEKHKRHIECGDQFKIPRNSISYVTLEPKLRIPSYIALRFNLKIDNVYKGLLLGTGPIIDPGYEGKLSIPLHNLTNNDYVFRGGDKIIWVEFTKISEHTRWKTTKDEISDENIERSDVFIPYSVSKADEEDERDLDYHLEEALEDQPEEIDRVRSSVGAALRNAVDASKNAQNAADRAESRAETARNQAQYISGGTIIAAILSVLAVIGAVASFIVSVQSYEDDVEKIRERVDKIESMVDTLEND